MKQRPAMWLAKQLADIIQQYWPMDKPVAARHLLCTDLIY